VTGESTDVPVAGIFFYVGNVPNTAFVSETVELDEAGYVMTDQNLESSVPGIFAAGDVRANRFKQVIIAAAEGALASAGAQRYLESIGRGPLMVIAVVDGMGGSIGTQIVLGLRQSLPEDTEIMALGTNAIATGSMMKAKATRGATGENAIAFSIKEADVIMGSLSIVVPNSMMGEVSPAIAAAVAAARGRKVLLPISNPPLDLLGLNKKPLQALIKDAVELVRDIYGLPTEQQEGPDV
jgi:hypothetical protein